MVSPLRTWKHPEPKGLWPAVGGLALMTHIGVIGLSLPYIGGLFSSNGNGTAVVPVTLIVETEKEALPAEISQGADNSDAVVDQEIATKSHPTHNQATPSAANKAATEAAQANEASLKQPSPDPIQPPPEPAQNIDSSNRSTEPEESEKEETSAEDTERSSGASANEAQPSIPESEESPPPDEPTPNDNGTLPVVGGGQLPAPGDASSEQGADQVTALSFSNHTLVADEFRTDILAITPPVPTEVFAASVRPQDVGCQEISEPLSIPLTYRVTISTGGTIQAATPWTGSNAASSLTESERSIVCLLERSGWRFAPATDEDGLPIPYSDLLLTFTLNLSTD